MTINRRRDQLRASLSVAAAIIALVCPALLGCASGSRRQDATALPAPPSTLVVEAAELTPLLAGVVAPTPPIIIVDARPIEQFEAGRLAGAVHLDFEAFNDAVRAPGSSADAAWAQRLGALGISGAERVLVYDEGIMTHAAAVWFILQHHGLTTAGVINGGYPEIAAAVRSDLLTRGPAQPPSPVTFTPPSGAAPLVGWSEKSDVLAALNSNARVFDARTTGEHDGSAPKDAAPGDPRTGHLPGAVNIPHASLLDDRGRLRPASEIREMLLDAGFRPGDRIVTHCHGGARGSLSALAAVYAGFGPVSNYYMSFSEWTADEQCPVEGGQPPF